MNNKELTKTLSEIKENISNKVYKNEEHIRSQLVLRVLQALGWDIWNPREIYTEYAINKYQGDLNDKGDASNPNNSNRSGIGGFGYVDIGILRRGKPLVFIEVKTPEYLKQNKNNLAKTEKQLMQYNFANAAQFTIITDGNQWRFYLSSASGTFRERLFYKFNINTPGKDNMDRILEGFNKFLHNNSFNNNNSIENARNYIQLGEVRKIIEDNLIDAKRRTAAPPYPTLPNVLTNILGEEHGFNINEKEVRQQLKILQDYKKGKTIVDSGVITKEKISGYGDYSDGIKSSKSRSSKSRTKGSRVIKSDKSILINGKGLKPTEVPKDMSFSKVEYRFNGETIKGWNSITEVLLKSSKGIYTIDDLKKKLPNYYLTIKTSELEPRINPKHPSKAKFGLHASTSFKAIKSFAKILNREIVLKIEFMQKSKYSGNSIEVLINKQGEAQLC